MNNHELDAILMSSGWGRPTSRPALDVMFGDHFIISSQLRLRYDAVPQTIDVVLGPMRASNLSSQVSQYVWQIV